MEIVVLGPPGSGKSTQCRHISNQYNIEHINVGGLLRENRGRITKNGKIGEIMDQGELVPKPIVNEMVMNAIGENEDYVLDGFPRTRSQAELLDTKQNLDIIIHLNIPLEVAEERIQDRLRCSDCNHIYNEKTKPPTDSDRCDKCGGTLNQRDDDNKNSAKNRIRKYAHQTEEVVQYLRQSERYASIDAEQRENRVFERISDVIDGR